MASTCQIYKGPILLGSGTIMANGFTVTSWVVDAAFKGKPILRRNVSVTNTQAGTHQGRTWRTRVVADNGSGTLTLADACPHVGA